MKVGDYVWESIRGPVRVEHVTPSGQVRAGGRRFTAKGEAIAPTFNEGPSTIRRLRPEDALAVAARRLNLRAYHSLRNLGGLMDWNIEHHGRGAQFVAQARLLGEELKKLAGSWDVDAHAAAILEEWRTLGCVEEGET